MARLRAAKGRSAAPVRPWGPVPAGLRGRGRPGFVGSGRRHGGGGDLPGDAPGEPAQPGLPVGAVRQGAGQRAVAGLHPPFQAAGLALSVS